MGFEVTVKFKLSNCGDCLMAHKGQCEGGLYCEHPKAEEHVDITEMDVSEYAREKTIPAWCPFVQDKLKDHEPCPHKGCLSHTTHPCEGCGRIGGK
jgi:hypothetical protein